MASKLYIEINRNENEVFVDLPSFLVIYVLNYLNCSDSTQLILIETKVKLSNRKRFQINDNILQGAKIEKNINKNIANIKFPAYVKGNWHIAGLCAVCREIISDLVEPNKRDDLLGFKGGCLIAPSETSIWTRFCEILLVDCINEILSIDLVNITEIGKYQIPETILQFESHLKQPVRVHNKYKLIEKCADVEHKFAEGFYLTLADLIIFPCIGFFFKTFSNNQSLKDTIPYVANWYKTLIEHDEKFYQVFEELNKSSIEYPHVKIDFTAQVDRNCSLYKCDPKRYNPRDRIFTKQNDVEESLKIILNTNINPTSKNGDENQEVHFDWTSVPKDATPIDGHLPEKRLKKKMHQLANVISPVTIMVKSGDRIVDFCCGSGHLGIILAAKLPQCHIMFVENKSISLKRAQMRLEDMSLKNVSFYQCNLDYFTGIFNIGISLHACGTATDIVIQKCLESQANFISSPCCYGGISPMPHVQYPLSQLYRGNLAERQYLHIAHSADQAHKTGLRNLQKAEQGELCMDVIDTDRKLLAEECGYQVKLTRMYPETCTPKNRLLIGLCQK